MAARRHPHSRHLRGSPSRRRVLDAGYWQTLWPRTLALTSADRAQPKGHVHPQRLQLLASLGHDIAALRSKLAEFIKEPQFDFVPTLCDDVASEAAPVWPGQPTTLTGALLDLAETKGTPAQVSQALSWDAVSVARYGGLSV